MFPKEYLTTESQRTLRLHREDSESGRYFELTRTFPNFERCDYLGARPCHNTDNRRTFSEENNGPSSLYPSRSCRFRFVRCGRRDKRKIEAVKAVARGTPARLQH